MLGPPKSVRLTKAVYPKDENAPIQYYPHVDALIKVIFSPNRTTREKAMKNINVLIPWNYKKTFT